MWAITLGLMALSVLLVVLNLGYPDTYLPNWWLGNTFVVIDATVGALVASRRPANPVGWLLCLWAVAVGASTFTALYAVYALLARDGTLPVGEAAAWITAWILPIIIGLQISYLLLFPTGRLPSYRWRWLAWLTGIFVVVGVITSAFAPDAYFGALGPIRNPLGIEGFTEIWTALLVTMAPLLYGATALSVLVRLRGSVGVERQQIKWFAYAVAIYAAATALNVATFGVDGPRWFELTGAVIFAAAGNLITISIGIAILRYKLFDIDIIINRTLVYGSLMAMLALVYFGCVTAGQALLGAVTGQQRLPQIAIVASTLAVAALFNPLRKRLQKFIDKRFYRSKYDAAKTLEEFGTALREATDLDDLRDEVTGVIRETVQPVYVSFWLAPARGDGDDG